jgi:hypothetical protein
MFRTDQWAIPGPFIYSEDFPSLRRRGKQLCSVFRSGLISDTNLS